MSSPSLRRAALVMILVTLGARVFGYVREAVVASVFGVSFELDLFLAAFTIPAILVSTVYHSIPNAFVPLWAHHGGKGPALRASVGVVGLSLISAMALTGCSGPLSHALLGGFGANDQARAASLLRIGAWTTVCATMEALLRSRLLALRNFGLPGLSYLWQGIGVIVATFGWPEHGAEALMWGTLLGMAASVLWNTAILRITAGHVPSSEESAVRPQSQSSIWTWIAVVLASASLMQLFNVVDRHWGSYLDPGVIAALNYAYLVADLPVALIAFALATAVLPFLSEAASDRDPTRTASITDRTVSWSLILTIPAAVWLTAFSDDLTRILFQRGAFDPAARGLTADLMSVAALGIVPVSAATALVRPFYAARRWAPIVISALAALAVKLASASWLAPEWGGVGLALASSAAHLALLATLGGFQHKVLSVYGIDWLRLALRVTVLVAVPTFAAQGLMHLLNTDEPLPRMLVAGIGILTGSLTLILVGQRWHIPQMEGLVATIRSAFRRDT